MIEVVVRNQNIPHKPNTMEVWFAKRDNGSIVVKSCYVNHEGVPSSEFYECAFDLPSDQSIGIRHGRFVQFPGGLFRTRGQQH